LLGIELGGVDGIFHSNTFLLENKYKWNGVVIECDPRFTKYLNKNRNCHTVI